MKKKLYLLCILCGLSLLLFSGYSFKEKQAVRRTIKAQFNQLKESDITAIQDYIHTQELLPGHLQDETLSQNVADIISLFYQDFSYRVKQISVKRRFCCCYGKGKNHGCQNPGQRFFQSSSHQKNPSSCQRLTGEF